MPAGAGGINSATGGSGRRRKAGTGKKRLSTRMSTGMTTFYEAQKGGGFGTFQTKRRRGGKKTLQRKAPAKSRAIG